MFYIQQLLVSIFSLFFSLSQIKRIGCAQDLLISKKQIIKTGY